LKPIIRRLSSIRDALADFPEAVSLVTFILIFLYFSANAKDFLSAYALSNILTFASVYGIIVIGIAFALITGEFDLSVGSTMAVASYILVLGIKAGFPTLLCLIAALLVSLVMGWINGYIVVTSNLPSFIITLGSMMAYRGLARILGSGIMVTIPETNKPAIFNILNGNLEWLNNLFKPAGNFRSSSFWFIGLIILVTLVLTRTSYGNWTFATGGNRMAALAQGVNVRRVRIINFMVSSGLAGFAGILLFAHRASTNPLMGNGLEMIAMAAAVIGGVRLNGGFGTIVGAAIGILLMTMMEQGLVLMGTPNEIFQAIVGVIIILSVIANTYLSKAEI
jgi:simple sugar transport system permease protein